MAKLKVYGYTGMPFRDTKPETRQVRVIVAATSCKAAVEVLRRAGQSNLTEGFLAKYGGETGNQVEIEVATARPGTVFWRSEWGSSKTEDYHPVEVPDGS